MNLKSQYGSNDSSVDKSDMQMNSSSTKFDYTLELDGLNVDLDEEDNAKLRKAIKRLAFNNSKLLPVYRKKYPDSENPLSTKSDMYNKLVIEAYGGKHDDIINENKIIKNIVKQTGIDKDQFSL
jgi:hypothetical protein